MAEKAIRFSPYCYTGDNPLRFADVFGMEGEDANKDGNDDNQSKSDGNEMVNFVRVKNLETGEITDIITGNADPGAEASYTDLTGNDGGGGGTKQDKELTVNGVQKDDKGHYVTKRLMTIKNPWKSGSINTDIHIPKGFNALTINATKFLSYITGHDAYMVAFTGDFAFGGGVGGAMDLVFINHGNDRGFYLYRAFDINVGYTAGIGIVGGPIDFNKAISPNIDRSSFEGWSFAASGGYGIAAGTYIRAYQDGALHLPGLPWNPPYLYSGYMGGVSKGQSGGMVNWSNAKLAASLPLNGK